MYFITYFLGVIIVKKCITKAFSLLESNKKVATLEIRFSHPFGKHKKK